MLQNHLRNISLYRVIKFLSSSRKTHMYPKDPFLPDFPALSSLFSDAVRAAKSTNRCELLWLLKRKLRCYPMRIQRPSLISKPLQCNRNMV